MKATIPASAWARWERDRWRLIRRAESQQARFNRHIEQNWPHVRWPQDKAQQREEGKQR